MTNPSEDDWYSMQCNYSKARNPLCDQCNTNQKLPAFYLQTPSYYRNKSSGHYFFCSQECMNNYTKSKVCYLCHYQQSLVEHTDGFMYCTDNPNRIMSCYDRVVGNYNCDYCKKSKNVYEDICYILRPPNGDDRTFMCEECFAPYKNQIKNRRFICEEFHGNPNYIQLIHDSCEELLELIRVNNQRFICNKCNEIKPISENNIVNNMNICKDCL